MITDMHTFVAPLTNDDIQIILELIEVDFADETNDFGDVGHTLGLVRDADICGALLDARKRIQALELEVKELRQRIEQ